MVNTVNARDVNSNLLLVLVCMCDRQHFYCSFVCLKHKAIFLIRFEKKIKMILEKYQKCVQNISVEYQAIIMYADGQLYLIQKKIQQKQKNKFSYKIHSESIRLY